MVKMFSVCLPLLWSISALFASFLHSCSPWWGTSGPAVTESAETGRYILAFAALHALVTMRLDVIGQGSHGKMKGQGSGEGKSGSVSRGDRWWDAEKGSAWAHQEIKTESVSSKRNKQDISRNYLPFQQRQCVTIQWGKAMSRQKGRHEGLMCWDTSRRFYYTFCNTPAVAGSVEVAPIAG